MADNEGWVPKDRDEYVGTLTDALKNVEQHKWDEALKLHDDKAEKDAKSQPPTPEGDPKPKRRGIL